MSTQVTIRQATTTDISEIDHFFRHIRRRYITFGTEDLPHLLRTGLVYLAQTGPLTWGVLAVSPRTPGWGQLRAVGLIDGWQAVAGVRLLFRHALPGLRGQGIHTLYCTLTEAWLHGPLEAVGFEVTERIVTLLRHAHSLPAIPSGPAELRLILPQELEQVEAVDAAAFPNKWHYTRRELAHMLTTGCRMAVATVHGEIVGYSCVEMKGEVGHIARVAVHPHWQEQGIGRQLVLDAMHYLSEAGATRLSLNTQQSNRRALHLYESLQFRRFGRVIPVLEKHLE